MRMSKDNRTAQIASFDPRRSHRFGLGAPGEVVLLEGSCPCQVNEISRHGARLVTGARIRVGEDGLLRCDGLDLLFRVVRLDQRVAVVQFVDELAECEGEIDPALAALIKNNYQILRFLET